MSIPALVVCEDSPRCCAGSNPWYGQGRTFLNVQTGFLLECAPGYSCDANAYPYPIIVPGGAIPFTPPTGENPLRIVCCDGTTLVEYLPDGFTQAQFDTAAQSLVDQAAEHLAGCMAADYNAMHATRKTNCSITTASPLAAVCNGTFITVEFNATGGNGSYTYSLEGGSLPPGIVLSGDMLIGTTATAGTYNFVIRVQDSRDCTGTKAFEMRVVEITTTDPMPDGSVGNAYSQALTETGGSGTLSWIVTAGALPDGLTLNSSTGLISGIPTDNGVFNFTVTLTSD